MSKKIIQVPIEDDLLGALDEASRSDRRSRADLIRQACRDYLQRRRSELLDRLYQEGYERVPEDAAVGETQLALLGQVLDKETW
jgi:metal-responsive CopG/Arc/MetJ family transcriptional regulator